MINRVQETQSPELAMDVDLTVGEETETVSVNATVLPLISADAKRLGTMVMLEDISGEKRVRSTMARYMDPGSPSASAKDEELLGGKSVEVTINVSDVRRFTTVAERLGAQGTVALLNELLHHHGRVHPATGRQCSTSSSVTRSWPLSASPSHTATTPTGAYAPRST